MTLTKEWLQQTIEEMEYDKATFPGDLNEDHGNVFEAMKMALAGMEAEPVVCPKCNDTGMADSGGVQPWGDEIMIPCDCSLPDPELSLLVHDLNIDGNHRLANLIQDLIEVKKAAPQPPTSSERAELENYRNAQPDMNYQHLSELYHAQEKRLFKLAQRIKGPAFDKYAHSPSQAIDALESAAFGENGDVSHAAMLQAGNHTVDANEKDKAEPVSNCDELATMTNQSEQVLDMVNSPVIQDGWVACSERMPEEDGNYWGWWSESKRQGPVWFIKSELQSQFQSSEITHWMPLPAAPQQEVK